MTTLGLAAWLILVAYAASHPRWTHGTPAARPGNAAPGAGQVRVAEPRPAVLALADAGQDANPEKPAKQAA